MAQADVAAEIERIKSVVGKYFPIYDVRVTHESLTMFVSPDPSTLEQEFEKLRKELKPLSYIPYIEYKSGEHVIHIARRPQVRPRGIWVNWVLLIVTFITTVVAGAFWWASYSSNDDLFSASNLLWGAVFFALPLLAILGAHELSHFLMSRRHGLEASLPFFIPSIPPLGTFGAFISMRDPMPDRKALVDVGVAGPLGGFLVTIPVAIAGLFLTAEGGITQGSIGGGAIGFMMQPLFELLTLVVPIPAGVVIHPMAFAAWVGMLVTAINLLPAGQLDGGHIARGLFGEKARYLSYATIGILFLMSLFYSGWIFFALIILFLGLRHPAPLNDISKLDLKRKAVGVVALVILIATFTPIPVVEIPPDYSFEASTIGSNNTTVAAPGVAVFEMTINNTGNTDIRLSLVAEIPGDLNASLYLSNRSADNATNRLDVDLPWQSTAQVTMRIGVPAMAMPGPRNVEVLVSSQGHTAILRFEIKVSG